MSQLDTYALQHSIDSPANEPIKEPTPDPEICQWCKAEKTDGECKNCNEE